MNPSDERKWTRRDVLRTMALSGLALRTAPSIIGQDATMMTRQIPSSGEELPVVGLGTWQTFDVGVSDVDRDPLREVLRLFVESGGTVIDSSTMYGQSEAVVGDLTAELEIRDDLFFATKVWKEGRADGIDQMNESYRLMKIDRIDLLQVHNLVDWETHLPTLRKWKSEGRLRYMGITHYQVRAYSRLEELIRTRQLDFVQFNFSMATRAAEDSLFPLAAEHGVATLINRPYEGGSLFGRVSGHDLPAWAAEFDCESW
ncbi:MAG: aldo/keto reductase, partial [Bacteroidetes bacterium]|nr:aldo/keto reductase [Bacteroidota bacterium]